MRALAASLLACTALAALVGCGQQDNSTPTACLSGSEGYEKALARLPAEVLIRGETPISDCLVANQEGGELERVGESLLQVATNANAEARQAGGERSAFALGYLMGAVQRGAERTEGIHSDLVRRLTVAARYSPDKEPLPPSFYALYREGFDAGRSGG
jgi:hypothetical protein